MLLHCEFEVFDSIFRMEDIMRVRANARAMMENVMKSGKLVQGGVFPDTRGFFMLLNADSADEIFDLLSPWANDMARMRIRPVMPLDKFPALMEKLGTRDVK